ncbi:hypothetical protein Q5O14_03105 [Eubacteriaceae bacterium ES2]|nr:hypothetical protein Q5O14_03105 [Eubacteriaceae bacterium ES2]
MKKIVLGFITTLMVVSLFTGCTGSSGSQTTSSSQTATATDSSQTDTDGDTLPDSVEKTYGTNPYAADTDGDSIPDNQDDNPIFAAMPFTTDGAAMNVEIVDAKVEDNATADHLEITFKNTGTTPLDQLSIYYTIDDPVTGQSEAYYQELTGLTLNSGEQTTIHFDNGTGTGHYPGNTNGIYGTSANGPTFTITLHDGQNEFTTFTVVKATGVEVAD